MKCEDCNKECMHFQSIDEVIDKENNLRQGRLYFRCPKCKTVYIQFNNIYTYKDGKCECVKEDLHVEKIPYVEKRTTLDKWM